MTVVELIESSEDTLKILDKNTDLKNFREYLSRCRAILIFPEVYEGVLFLVQKVEMEFLIIKRAKFTGPFFYSLGGLSFGLQAGAKSGRVVMTVMTQ